MLCLCRLGKTCQNWDSQSPHSHNTATSGWGVRGNYCRNPDGKSGIWCYTTDPGTPFEYCDPMPAPTLHGAPITYSAFLTGTYTFTNVARGVAPRTRALTLTLIGWLHAPGPYLRPNCPP